MADLKTIVGKNLASLRKAKKLTQIELAEKLQYSDKAISKWEQGSTLPDIETLKSLCDFYGVTLDYLTNPDNIKNPNYDDNQAKVIFINRIVMSALFGSIVWMIATIIFVYPLVFKGQQVSYWPIFVLAVPATSLLILFLDVIFFKKNRIVAFIFSTIMVWSLLGYIFLHFYFFADASTNLWPIFLIGLPSQAILILWFIMRKKVPNTKKAS